MLSFLYTLIDDNERPKIEYIYNKFHNDMVRLAKSKLRRMGVPNYDLDAEDTVQRSFIKIAKYLGSINFNVGDGPLKSYIFSVVTNEARETRKEYTHTDDIEEYAEKLTDDEFILSMQIHERYEQVVAAIRRMDDKYSTILLFRFCEEMTIPEIAQLLELPEKTVYTRLERGKKILLETIEKEDQEDDGKLR